MWLEGEGVRKAETKLYGAWAKGKGLDFVLGTMRWPLLVLNKVLAGSH